MQTRQDGEETKVKILAAATKVFGEKGFRDATHAEICESAAVNIASINYYFRSKSELYRTVWHAMMEELNRRYPLSSEKGLEGVIEAILRRTLDPDLGTFSRLFMMEFHNSTGLVDDLLKERFEGYRSIVHGLLREMLGEEATKQQIELCEMSVISQCRAVQMSQHGSETGRICPPWQFTQADLDRLQEHIVRFSLAGIQALRET